jgi:2-polyprenyl-3-methyl-5-hydroxy-6-metoxy-1,4-benzoquinol methylase
MIEVSNCVICDGAIRGIKRALVSPFLAARIWNRRPFCVELVECEACGFMFYNPRLDDAEAGRLYAGYRSEEYQRMRQASEPWYTVSFNAKLTSPAAYERRRSVLAAILRQHIGKREIKRVLDYGGDRGDLARGLVHGAAVFVYDISGFPAVDGVTAASDPAECQADLVINSNVFEHVGFPRLLLEDIVKATPPGGTVFLEVPRESPLGLSRISRRIAQLGIVALTRPALARYVLRPAGLYLMHEHINYFSEQSLTTLMRSCGCAVTEVGSYVMDSGVEKAQMVWCLGTVT